MSRPKYRDVGGPNGLPEDERITLIGNRAMLGQRVAVLLEGEAEAPGKIDRYVAKVIAKYPAVECVERRNYTADGMIVAVFFERRPN